MSFGFAAPATRKAPTLSEERRSSSSSIAPSELTGSLAQSATAGGPGDAAAVAAAVAAIAAANRRPPPPRRIPPRLRTIDGIIEAAEEDRLEKAPLKSASEVKMARAAVTSAKLREPSANVRAPKKVMAIKDKETGNRPGLSRVDNTYHDTRVVKVVAQYEHEKWLKSKGLLEPTRRALAQQERLRRLGINAELLKPSRSAPTLPDEARKAPPRDRIHTEPWRPLLKTGPPPRRQTYAPPNEKAYTAAVNRQLVGWTDGALKGRLANTPGFLNLSEDKQRRLRRLVDDALPSCHARPAEERREDELQMAAATRLLYDYRAERARGRTLHAM